MAERRPKSRFLSKPSEEEITEFCMAARDNDIAVVSEMLRVYGMNIVNKKDKEFGDTALVWASYCGHLDIMNLLLEKGADVDGVGLFNSTALVWAVMGGQPEAVEILLKNGADLDRKSKEGKTPLTIAQERGFFDIVEMLEQCPLDRRKKKDDLLGKAAREARIQRVRAKVSSKLIFKKNDK